MGGGGLKSVSYTKQSIVPIANDTLQSRFYLALEIKFYNSTFQNKQKMSKFLACLKLRAAS